MNIGRINKSPRLSGAVIYNGTIFFSGQVPTNRKLDIRGQTLEVLSKIDELLMASGSDRSRLLSAQIWLKDIDRDFTAMNDVWTNWLPEGAAPARATVEARLASEDVLVEIMVIAATSA